MTRGTEMTPAMTGSDPENMSPSPAREGTQDPREQEDAAAVQSAPSLDEDEIAVDPLEEGVEPPEHWSKAVRELPTPRQEREGPTVDDRLAAERPDTDAVDPRPLAETRMHELDESVDERAASEVADEEGERPQE